MLIIDKRSMISLLLIISAERNVRDCAYGQKNQEELWGGIPVVFLFGDDYQLFPVGEDGAINGFYKMQKLWEEGESRELPQQQLIPYKGHQLFISDLTRDVFELMKNYRNIKDTENEAILEQLRFGAATQADGARFMKQCLHFYERLHD